MFHAQALLFDFDGVILESVAVKGWAFGKLFEDYPEHIETIVRYHITNGGVSRFIKFHHIYKHFLKKSLSDAQFDRLCRRYSELVFEKVVASDFVPGASEFLEKYSAQIPLFVISGTPQEEMTRVVEARQLTRHFKEVLGSPRDKNYWVNYIMRQYGFDCDKVYFIGDALSDHDAAVDNGITFIARVPRNGEDIFSTLSPTNKIADLTTLERTLSGLEKSRHCANESN